MGKGATFQDFSAGSPPEGQDLWRWLYVELRAAILDGRLKAGARMPSTRSLATQYSLSRGTVVAAFDQLQSEGYTHTKVGSGTYVALEVTGRAVSDESTPDLSSGSRQSKARLSKWGERYLRKADVVSAPLHVGCAFRDYEPATDLFPTELWARVASRVLRRAPRSLYGKGNAKGHQPLRRAIAEYVGSSRGVRCSPEQIIVTAGTQQALDLLARFLIDPEDKIWMEDPGYPGASQAFVSAGGRIVPVPLDQEGLIVKAGRKLAPQAKLAYVTPANQFPMGVTMSADRRVELLRWAAGANAWIIEDEYDAEYRYFGRPVASLQALDRSNCVVYVGTFTKMLFYALRLGFIVLPERIVDAFAAARSFVDRHPPTLDQAILAEFISDGHFGHHVRRMRQLYSERMDILKAAADKQLGRRVTYCLTQQEMQKVAQLKQQAPAFAAMRKLALRFRGILRGQDPAKLDSWLDDAHRSSLYGLRRFAYTVRHDLAAVRNAISEIWSNGQTEGHINRLKTLKRQMYGRAGTELLRARLLPVFCND